MRILHTADWHLGRIFYQTHLTEDQAHILGQIIDVIRHEKPDLVIVAGDIFDRAVPPPDAVRLLDDTVSEIVLGLGVPLAMISGNHDSPGRLGYGANLLARQGLHVMTDLKSVARPLTMEDEHGPVDVFSIPFGEPARVREAFPGSHVRTHDDAFGHLVDRIVSARETLPSPGQRRAVLIAHLHVEGGLASDSERPLVFGGSSIVERHRFKPFDYVALGHLHRPQNLGSTRIRYSGSPLKYSFSEVSDSKSVSLVELDKVGYARVREITLSARRDVRRVEGHLEDFIGEEALRDPGRDDYLEVTLLDRGSVIDAIGKIRAVYPNVLHIVRPEFHPEDELEVPPGDHRLANPHALFTEFFSQVTGEELEDDEDNAFVEVLNEIEGPS